MLTRMVKSISLSGKHSESKDKSKEVRTGKALGTKVFLRLITQVRLRVKAKAVLV